MYAYIHRFICHIYINAGMRLGHYGSLIPPPWWGPSAGIAVVGLSYAKFVVSVVCIVLLCYVQICVSVVCSLGLCYVQSLVCGMCCLWSVLLCGI